MPSEVTDCRVWMMMTQAVVVGPVSRSALSASKLSVGSARSPLAQLQPRNARRLWLRSEREPQIYQRCPI